MIKTVSFGALCFAPLDGSGVKIFGFPEFLAGFALIVLVWTIADVRYQFRVSTAPLPLRWITFGVMLAVGALTLLTDLWRAEQWLVPDGQLITPTEWQALLAGLFLLTVLTWAWFAFIQAPAFGKLNARRYGNDLYRAILKGSPTELAIIADEFAHSAKSVIHHAPLEHEIERSNRRAARNENPSVTKVQAFANEILLLISDKRFCRAMVESSPGTALTIFLAIKDKKKYRIRVQIFAKNIVAEALANKDSFLFHEAEGYETGLFGYRKPLSQAMFASHRMVEEIGTLLDVPAESRKAWDEVQWRAYSRVVLMTLQDYVAQGSGEHSYVLYRAMDNIQRAASDLYKINLLPMVDWENEILQRLRMVVDFLKAAIDILDKKGVPKHLQLRFRGEVKQASKTIYDHLADMIFSIILAAADVSAPESLCRLIQRDFVWIELFDFYDPSTGAAKVVQFKVRRLLYDEITKMNGFPNFKGARILAYCLNVMGLRLHKVSFTRNSQALQKTVLGWVKRNYAQLYFDNQRVAESCLVEGITYDVENHRLVHTALDSGIRSNTVYTYLEVSPTAVAHKSLVQHHLLARDRIKAKLKHLQDSKR